MNARERKRPRHWPYAVLITTLGAGALWAHKKRRQAPTTPAQAPAATQTQTTDLDWGDAGLGPNCALADGENHTLKTRVRVQPQLVLDPVVAQRFNAYAMHAFPREIGGLLRVIEQSDGSVRAIDLHIFPHVAASGGYFELDGAAVAEHNLDLLRRGRKEEISEWCSLIHSHPGFAPFLSGTDRENVCRLAGQGRAYSLICSAHANPQANYYAWHYAQGGALPLVICNLPYNTSDDLTGVDSLSEAELEVIAEETRAALACVRSNSWSGRQKQTTATSEELKPQKRLAKNKKVTAAAPKAKNNSTLSRLGPTPPLH